MAYKTYTTDALVVGSEARYTADRTIALFTREAGLVFARAMGVRKERSKLRYGLQDFSMVRVSLVRGKQGWRVIGAERMQNLYFAASNLEVRAALLRTLKIVRRLVRGEEAHPALYDVLIDGLCTLASGMVADVSRAEQLLAARVLAALGYVAPRPAYVAALRAASLSEALRGEEVDAEEGRALRSAIDRALSVSQL